MLSVVVIVGSAQGPAFMRAGALSRASSVQRRSGTGSCTVLSEVVSEVVFYRLQLAGTGLSSACENPSSEMESSDGRRPRAEAAGHVGRLGLSVAKKDRSCRREDGRRSRDGRRSNDDDDDERGRRRTRLEDEKFADLLQKRRRRRVATQERIDDAKVLGDVVDGRKSHKTD